MPESPHKKPVYRFVSVIEIDSGTHGLLRFRNWTAKAGTAIAKLCNAGLIPRRFAEDLFVQLATDPLLTEADFQQWTGAALLELAVKWWNVVDHRRRSPIAVDCLEAFRNAVRQRNAEHRGGLRPR